MYFTPNSHFSLGVEIEFQVIDRTTLNLSPLAPILLENSPAILAPRITHELIQSILELQTGVCTSLRDVENDLMETCSMAEELASDNDCLLFAASLHPFALASEQVLTINERYQRIMHELQIVGRRFISQGLHVHVGMPDGDTAMRVSSAIQQYLPLLLALSCSSPFSAGEDTGLMSYRSKLFEVLPMAGIYDPYGGWQEFIDEVDNLIHYGVISSISDLWWDARPNPKYGTIEIRVCDLPGRFSDILALVSLIQALAAFLAREWKGEKSVSMNLIRANKWQAVRYGLEGAFIDPSLFLSSDKLTIREAIAVLLERVHDQAKSLRCLPYLEGIERILHCGNSAQNQRRIFDETKSFQKVIQQMHEEFWQ